MKQQNKIPEGWEYKKISQVSESHAGGTPSRAEKRYYGGSILWVKSGEVDNRDIIDTEEKITEEALKNSSAKIVPKNTVLVAMYGATVGKVGILRKEATTNQAVLAIISKNNSFDCEFMYYLLSSKTHKLINTTQGTGQPNLSKDLIDNLEVIIPPLSEQKAISKIFSEVDLELDNIGRERQATERIKRGIMVKLLENSSWKKVKLGELINFKRGFSYRSEQISDKPIGKRKLFTINNFDKDGGIKQNAEDIFLGDKIDISMDFIIKEGDILVANTDMSKGLIIGAPTLLKELKDEFIFSMDLTKLIFDKKKIHPEFLFYFLRLEKVRRIMKMNAQGTNVLHLNHDLIKSQIEIPLPSIEEQKRIALILSTVDQKLDLELKRKDKLERIKKGLMNDLLTGEKRVNVDKVLKIGEEK